MVDGEKGCSSRLGEGFRGEFLPWEGLEDLLLLSVQRARSLGSLPPDYHHLYVVVSLPHTYFFFYIKMQFLSFS
jgi:hypothetical protein